MRLQQSVLLAVVAMVTTATASSYTDAEGHIYKETVPTPSPVDYAAYVASVARMATPSFYTDAQGNTYTATVPAPSPKPSQGAAHYVSVVVSMESMAAEQAAAATAPLDPAKAVFTFSPRRKDGGKS